MRFWLLAGLVVASACTEQDPPAPVKDAAPKGAWHEVQTPVPMHKKLACEPVFGDSAKVSAAMEQPVEVHDVSSRDTEATTACRFLIAGKPGAPTPPKLPPRAAPKKPPKEAKDVKDAPDIQAGEEMCTVTAYCWWAFTVGDIRKKCEEGGEEVSQEFGDITCMRKVSAGETAFRYDLTVLDTDSRCKVVVQAGPNVRDLATVKSCTRAAVDLISPDSLKSALTWTGVDAGVPASAPAKTP